MANEKRPGANVFENEETKYIFTRILKVLTPQNASYARLPAYFTEETNTSLNLYTPSPT